ncbi:MAG: chromate transporter [Acetobacteraceae bacterium]|nr:chromate transporter [Acetobacteraceae bacterium]
MTGGTLALLIQLTLVFAPLSLAAIGGAIAVLPEIQRQVVEIHGWVTADSFMDLFALAQAAPGPNMMVVSLIGWQVAGVVGLLVATIAMVGPPALLALALGRLRARFAGLSWVRVTQAGLIPIALGLNLASGVVLAQAAHQGVTTLVLTLGTTLFVWLTRWSPLWTLAVGAVAGMAAS